MIGKRYFLLLAALLLIMSCSTSRNYTGISLESDKEQPAGSYRLSWSKIEIIPADPHELKYIENEIRKQLNDLGYRENTGVPDMIISLFYLGREKTEYMQDPKYFVDPYAHGSPYVDYSDYQLRNITEPYIIVRIADLANKVVVWEATASLGNYKDTVNRYRCIEKSIAKMFRKFKPRSFSSLQEELIPYPSPDFLFMPELCSFAPSVTGDG